MSLTRRFLAGFGLTEEQVSAIVEAHTETINALKDQRDQYKEDADKLPGVQKELEALKNAEDGTNEWQEKYEKEHADFESYKAAQAEKETTAAKQTAYRDLLKAAGVAEKRIDTVLKVTDLSELELADGGKLKNSEDLTKAIKETWSDFITTTETEGADTKTPPDGGNDGGTIPDIPAFF